MIKIKVADKELLDGVKKLSSKASNMSTLMSKVGGIMANAVEENFEKEGKPKWKSLADATIKARIRKKRWPGKILQQTGQLVASIQTQHSQSIAVVGTNKAYAPLHQFGFAGDINVKSHTRRLKEKKKPKKKDKKGKQESKSDSITVKAHKRYMSVPPRPFLVLKSKDKSKINKAVRKYFSLS